MSGRFAAESGRSKTEWRPLSTVNCTENIRKYCYEKFRHSLCHGWADRLVKTAKNAGCKYITLTTRHHDGFQGIPSVSA